MDKTSDQIKKLQFILQSLENIYDQRTPKFGEVSKEDLQELRHWSIFVHSEINDGITFAIIRYLYPKGVVFQKDDPVGTQMARAMFVNNNWLKNMGFTRRLELLKILAKEVYELDPDVFRLIKIVDDIRNDFAHPTMNSLSKYVSYRRLHHAYVDLLKGISEFKVAIEKIKETKLFLET